jgi:hypothetical protein
MALPIARCASPQDRLHAWPGVAPPAHAWKLGGQARQADAVMRALVPVFTVSPAEKLLAFHDAVNGRDRLGNPLRAVGPA